VCVCLHRERESVSKGNLLRIDDIVRNPLRLKVSGERERERERQREREREGERERGIGG